MLTRNSFLGQAFSVEVHPYGFWMSGSGNRFGLNEIVTDPISTGSFGRAPWASAGEGIDR